MKQDSIALLQHCNTGVKMGITAIEEVLPAARDHRLKTILTHYKEENTRLGQETGDLLRSYGEDGKAPGPLAKGMSWMKTNMKLTMDPSDSTVADLMTDGCNMGIKYLNQYLNEYESADQKVKHLAHRLLDLETRMAEDVRSYL